MQTHNRSVAHASQAVAPHKNIERVHVTPELDDKLRAIIRNKLRNYPCALDLHHVIEVHHVIPCPSCGMPVTMVDFEGRYLEYRICDAQPHATWKVWTTDVLEVHAC